MAFIIKFKYFPLNRPWQADRVLAFDAVAELDRRGLSIHHPEQSLEPVVRSSDKQGREIP
jgi:hypothetical protein